ncbi:MAG: hypothetical protein QG656_292 [Candidatus Hydrogenedentes bacterium]|nr:hypothetical protein [Candidatus Hydrogenedentota bacterium]
MRSAAICGFVLALGLGAFAGDGPVWLVVGRPGLVEAIGPLADYRRAEGLEVVVSTDPVEQAIAQAPRVPEFLLLVGDDESGKEAEPWYLPAKQVPFYRWNDKQPETFASDGAWGDLDGNGMPDIAVGRLPVRTPEEAAAMAAKILAYEQRPPCVDDLRLLAWAGAPGYGEMIDTLFSNMLVNLLVKEAPAWMEYWLIASDRSHALCGWPPDQTARFAEQMRRGSLITVFMGHGSKGRLRSMMFNEKLVAFTEEDVKTYCGEGAPTAPIVLYTCGSGEFTIADRCMAELFVLSPGGPVAAIGATTDSHPIPNHFSAVSLMDLLSGPEKRFGKLWLEAIRRAETASDPLMDYFVSMAKRPEAKMDVARLKLDQRLMFNLLGDPAMAIKVPDQVEVRVEKTAEGWHWSATKPAEGATLEVGRRALVPLVKPVAGELDAEAANRAAEEADAAFTFKPVERATDAAWEGVETESVRLRWVTTGGGRIGVATQDLTPSAP